MARLPLTHIRVADFTWAAAGPYSTLLLANLGAQVVKVTTTRHLGGIPRRRAGDMDRSLNYNKRSLSLDLTTSKGVALARELIKVSDVVVENYRPGTMQRFGLDYPELVKVKPDIIMVSASALGAQGPPSRYAGFAPIFAAMAGLSYVTGYPDGIPSELRLVIDYSVGLTLAYATLVALYYRYQTGQGQYIDLAGRDTVACLVGEVLLDALVNGRNQGRQGNGDDIMAPHGVYPCRGEDAWVTIAVATDEEWQALVEAMGNPGWAFDQRFADGYRRWANREELDRHLRSWTAQFTPFELMHLLQARGVAAVPSYSARDTFSDPHLAERGFASKVTSSSGETYTVLAAPWLTDGLRPEVRRHAPYPGEDNEPLLRELLGLSSREVAQLEEEGVLR